VPTFLLIPLIVLGVLVVVFGVLVFLTRFRGGALLRPIVAFLSKIPFMRRWFQKMSTVALERQNPELASALKKMQRLAGPNPDPQRAQQALSALTAAERRAYLDAVADQGAMPAANRQMRRQQQRLQAGGGPKPSGGKPGASGKPSGGSKPSRGGKKRR
jgi:hypothetical protein